MIRRRSLLALALLWGACEAHHEPIADDWNDTTASSYQFAGPHCHAPGTQHAESYREHHESGGNALLWWMTMQALNSGSTHHETTHVVHHYQPTRNSGWTYRTRPAPVRLSAPVKYSPPKSPSYGFKASSSLRPSSSRFSGGRR